jgi:NRPS condensation-like uncharacterized protein
MKKYRTLIALVVASLMLNAQSDKTSKLVMGESNSEIGILDDDNPDYKNEEHSIITVLVNKNWNGIGMLMGKKATFTMDWQRVLGNQFIKLEFQNKRKSGNTEDIIFRATAFYKIVNDTMVIGNWFDNRGISLPLKGSIKENELTILWGNDETEMGKTIYRYTSNNEITVKDFIMNNGKYIKFGYATYNTKD